MVDERIKALFEPRSVAVIGASRNPKKTGHIILKNIIDAGFKGRIYPINPKAGEILGLKAYPSIKDVPDDVDLAVFVIPAKFVPDAMEEAGEKGVKAAVIISGGFRELGTPEGRELEERLKAVARKHGIRFLGPNCQGVNNPHLGLCASWPLIKAAGPLAIVSQSGTFAATFEYWAEREGIGISKMAALGNKADINEIDLLEYLGEDPDTKAVALYIEAVSDGRRFLEVAEEVSRKKPVIVFKSGRTESGAKAVASHTGSLAGSYKVYLAAFKKVGAIPVDSLEELYDYAKGLAMLPRKLVKTVQIVTSSGGSGIVSTDYAEMLGFTMNRLKEDIAAALRSKLPSHCIIKNPLDLTGDADAARYDAAFEELFKDDSIDAIITIFGDPIEGAAEVVEKWYNKGKVIIPIYLGGGEVEEVERLKMHKKGIPVFPTPERGVKTLRALRDYVEWLRSKGLA